MRYGWLIVLGLLMMIIIVSQQGKGLTGSDQNLYRDPADEKIKVDLKKIWSKKSPPRLIVDKRDQQVLRDGEEDVRVLRLLNELKKRHILAVRIESGYDNYGALSRESDPGWQSISPHSRGRVQAFDIFWADGVEVGWQAETAKVKRQKSQDKIRQILKEILMIGRKNSYYLPTQICVYRRTDIQTFSREARELYGGYPPETGLRGMMTGSRYWDRIHIGY